MSIGSNILLLILQIDNLKTETLNKNALTINELDKE